MQRAEVYIVSQEVLNLGGSAAQFELHVTGSLPSPCHELRAVVDEPDEQNRIYVQVYSMTGQGAACAQELRTFDARIPLGSFPSGTYTIFMNGEHVGKASF